MDLKLTIIMPVYNEEKTIKQILSKVRAVDLGKIEKEIIVVNDCSTDRTLDVLKKERGITLISHSVNKGKGSAIRTGLSRMTGDVMVIQDGDLELDPNEFKKLIKPIISRETKVVYGSRILGQRQSDKDRGVTLHNVGNIILSKMTSLLYGSKITDMETCYKMVSKDVLSNIKLRARRFDFEPEITAKILKSGQGIKELPIAYEPRGAEEGKKIDWRDGVKAMWYLIKFRFVD